MTIRRLDPGVALLVIDFQEGTRRFVGEAGPGAYAAASRLCSTFRKNHLPVLLIQMRGGPAGRSDVAADGSNHLFPAEAQTFVPELAGEPSDIVIGKASWGAFSGTDLQKRLAEMAVTHVVLCGTAASIGVESTARQAYEAGLNVTIALDAVTDFNPEALRNSAERIFPMLAETGRSDEIIAILDAV